MDTIESSNEKNNQEKEQKPVIDLRISSDNMAAYINVKPAYEGQNISYEDIVSFLEKNNIVYGICREAIKDFCKNKKYYIELQCARGLAPIDEEDSKMEYLFKVTQNILPTEREDGTMDFRDLGLVQNVSKGDVLCRIIKPAPGTDGIDIYNNPVKYKKGRVPGFPGGNNTVISDDGLTLSAAIDGCIEYKKSILNINDVFIIRGDVDSASGNIDFLGTVTIQGDVREGFSVKAGKDIVVRGMVEGAMLDAGENIIISNGMNGMGKGVLKAGDNVTGKYFENVTINCGGNITADVIMNSRVAAGNAVILKGRKALLVGGTCRAGRRIYANTIGSASNVRTEVSIDSDVLNKFLNKSGSVSKIGELKAKLAEEKKSAGEINRQVSQIMQIISKVKGNPKAQQLLKSILKKKALTDAGIKDLEGKISAEQKDSEREKNNTDDPSFLDFNIIGNKIIYVGTKMEIGSFTLSLANDYSNTKFYADKEQIVGVPVLPSDKITY